MDQLIFNLFVDWVDKIRWLNIVMKFEFENFFYYCENVRDEHYMDQLFLYEKTKHC